MVRFRAGVRALGLGLGSHGFKTWQAAEHNSLGGNFARTFKPLKKCILPSLRVRFRVRVRFKVGVVCICVAGLAYP